MDDIKPVALLPCCGYDNTSAVYWNPYNKVCQCHNCGHVYTPILPESALAQAKEEGRREGMREAADICEKVLGKRERNPYIDRSAYESACDDCMDAITSAAEGK